jgi:predicted acylesterase/phospholipase RssA
LVSTGTSGTSEAQGSPCAVPTTVSLGLALSGGGFRASCFALGVLHYLNDRGRLGDINAVSSVSGGSITNGYLAMQTTIPERHHELEMRRRLAMFASGLAHTGVIGVATAFTYAFLLAMTFVAFAGVFHWMLAEAGRLPVAPLPGGSAFFVATASSIASLFVTLLVASSFFDEAVKIRLSQLLRDRDRLYSRGTSLRQGEPDMNQLAPPYTMILCSTDLGSGAPFYFAPHFVVAPGHGRIGDHVSEPKLVARHYDRFSLHDGVLASAAFPGAIRPRKISSRQLGFDPTDAPGDYLLGDGGLRDNTGVSFFLAWRNQSLPRQVMAELGPFPDQLLVVNSAAPVRRFPRTKVLLRLRSVPLSMSALHQANTRSVLHRLDVESATGTVTLSITDDPWIIANGSSGNAPHDEAIAALRRLHSATPSCGPLWWSKVAADSPNVRTGLRGLGTEDAATLMFHGYVVAMTRLAVASGWPPVDPVPTLDEFRAMCRYRTPWQWRRWSPQDRQAMVSSGSS